MSSLKERLLGEWSSPTTVLKKRLFCYCLRHFCPLILPLPTSLELELLNGYARLENVCLDPLSVKSFLTILNENVEIEKVIVEELEIWIAWDKVLAMYDSEYDLSTFDVAAVAIQTKGIKVSIKWESLREPSPEPEQLKASILVQSEIRESIPPDDINSKRMQGSLESIPEEVDEESSKWMKRILEDTHVSIQDILINVNELNIKLESFKFTTMDSNISGFSIELGDKSVIERIETIVFEKDVIETPLIHLHLYPELAMFTNILRFESQAITKNASSSRIKISELVITVHSEEHTLKVSGKDLLLSTESLQIHEFTCTANGLNIVSNQFAVIKCGTKSFELQPFKVHLKSCFIDTFNSLLSPWMNLGSYRQGVLNLSCPRIDLNLSNHVMTIERVNFALSSSIKMNIEMINSSDFTISHIKIGFKNTLKKSTLNLTMFYPEGHFPFDSTKMMLEDTKFIKCSSSNIPLFKKLAERSQRVLEVSVGKVKTEKDITTLDIHQHIPSKSTDTLATLVLIKIEDITISHRSNCKNVFLGCFVNDQVMLGDLRLDLQSFQYSSMNMERSLVSSNEYNVCASFIKRDALTLAVETDGLLFSMNELPKVTFNSLTTDSINFYAFMKRSSFKPSSIRDNDAIVYVDSLKVTSKIFYGSLLAVYYGNMKPVGMLYSNPDIKWTDAGLTKIAYSDVIYGKICGSCIELIENEFTILLDSKLINSFGPMRFNNETNVDIKSMMSINDFTDKAKVAVDEDISNSSVLSEEGVINRLDELSIEDDYMVGVEEELEFPFRDASQCFRLRDCSIKIRVPNLAILHFNGFNLQVEENGKMLRVNELRGYDLRPDGKWPLFLHRKFIDSSLPDLNLTVDEGNFKFRMMPLRIRIDQGLLISLSDLLPSFESGGESKRFNVIHIAPVHLSIDYQPRRLKLVNVPKHPLEMLNLFPIRDAQLSLSAIKATNSSIGVCLVDSWLPTLTSNQHTKAFINSLTPVRTMVRVGSGFASLLLLPIKQYRQDGRLLRGLTDGVTAFTHTAGIELTHMGANVFTAAADFLSTFTDTRTDSTSLNHIRHTIIAVPVQDGDIIRAVPIAILNAVQGASEGVAFAMRAVNRKLTGLTFEREILEEDDDKGKSPLIHHEDFNDCEEEDDDSVIGL